MTLRRTLLRLAALSCVIATPLVAAADDTKAQDHQYFEKCKEEVGVLPPIDCSNGVPVPITVSGKTPSQYTSGMTCDRPAMLPNGDDSDGQCVPNSRILNLSTGKMMVSVMCRQKHIRPEGSMDFDEIDVVAYNSQTGATCWFQAEAADTAHPIDGTKVPSPEDDTHKKSGAPTEPFWTSPTAIAKDKETGCGLCHDNDPIMYSPFVGQVWDHVPEAPFGPYFHVDPGLGFGNWPTETINPRDNACVSCHRIGIQETCGDLMNKMTGKVPLDGADFAALHWPLSHAMPPDFDRSEATWQTIYGPSLRQIQSCCLDPSQPFCHTTKIPSSEDQTQARSK